jgi:hypothetical protein
MTTVVPEGEALRKAVRWIAEERALASRKTLVALVEAASVKFDLSPAEADFLLRSLSSVRPPH